MLHYRDLNCPPGHSFRGGICAPQPMLTGLGECAWCISGGLQAYAAVAVESRQWDVAYIGTRLGGIDVRDGFCGRDLSTLRMKLQPAFRCSSLGSLDTGSGRTENPGNMSGTGVYHGIFIPESQY